MYVFISSRSPPLLVIKKNKKNGTAGPHPSGIQTGCILSANIGKNLHIPRKHCKKMQNYERSAWRGALLALPTE